MKKKIIKIAIAVLLVLVLVWSSMVIIDYNRAKDLKAPLFAYKTECDENGNGFYKCPGYTVYGRTYPFNGKDHILYDMNFYLLGGASKPKRTISMSSTHMYLQLGESEEKISEYIEALKYITPEVSGNQTVYSEHANIDGAKVVQSLIFYNGVLAGYEYDYNNIKTAYEHAKRLRRDLELTYGEKTTYPGMIQTNKDYFDNVKDISDLKKQYTYFEDWTASFEGEKQENINKMLSGKPSSRVDIRFELTVIDTDKVVLSVRYLALR